MNLNLAVFDSFLSKLLRDFFANIRNMMNKNKPETTPPRKGSDLLLVMSDQVGAPSCQSRCEAPAASSDLGFNAPWPSNAKNQTDLKRHLSCQRAYIIILSGKFARKNRKRGM